MRHQIISHKYQNFIFCIPNEMFSVWIISCLVCIFLMPTVVFANNEKTLGEIRKELLGKEVIIFGAKAKFLDKKYVLLDWWIAEGNNKTGYKKKKSNYMDVHAPYSLKLSKGIVVAIEPRDILSDIFSGSSNNKKSKDLFGDNIKNDDMVNSDMNIVVKCFYFEEIRPRIKLQKEVLLMTNSFYRTIFSNLRLATDYYQEKKEILENIDSLIGKTLYPVNDSRVFLPTADINDMIEIKERYKQKLCRIDNFTPMKIVRAKYIENEHIMIIKVEFNNNNGLIPAHYMYMQESDEKKKPFIEKLFFGYCFHKIPDGLTNEEVEAIKKSAFFTGMSEKALEYSIGSPKKKNEYGGSKQLIYSGGNLIVYTENNKVISWQRFE